MLHAHSSDITNCFIYTFFEIIEGLWEYVSRQHYHYNSVFFTSAMLRPKQVLFRLVKKQVPFSIDIEGKGKVFYGQEPPSGEFTSTECRVNYQILAVIY